MHFFSIEVFAGKPFHHDFRVSQMCWWCTHFTPSACVATAAETGCLLSGREILPLIKAPPEVALRWFDEGCQRTGLIQQQQKNKISPVYCTIVPSSCGSWACVFSSLSHPLCSLSLTCSFAPSISVTPLSQLLLQQWSLSAFFTLLDVPLFSLCYCTFYFFLCGAAEMSSRLVAVPWS